MQIINNWPDQNKLTLPENVRKSLINKLALPFHGDVKEAQAFWQEVPSSLVNIQANEPETLLNKLDDVTKHFIEEALTNPENIDALGDGYFLWLTITNNEGAGMYVITPPDFSIHLGKGDKSA